MESHVFCTVFFFFQQLLFSNLGIDKLQINTDSQFMIKCVTEWMPKWQKNGWKLSTGGDVKNRVQLVDLHNAMDKLNVQVRWVLKTILFLFLFAYSVNPFYNPTIWNSPCLISVTTLM